MERPQPFVVRLAIVVLLLISLIPAAMARGSDGSSETTELSEPLSAKETKGGDAPVATLTDEVVVTATARREAARKLPFVTTVLDAEVLRDQRQVRTLPEALREVPGVMVQKTGHGQGSPFLRGFTGFRTLLLIDGVRLDTSVMREGPNQYWTTVDAWALKRIEVVKGPVSVLWGSHSIGGTVQALTPDPPPAGTPSLAGALRYRWASAEHSHFGRLDLRGALGARAAYTLGASTKSHGDLEAGGEVGRQPRTGYVEHGFDAKLRFDLAEDTLLTSALQSSEVDDAWRTHRTIFALPWRGTTVGNELRRVLDQRRELGYLRFDRQRAGPLWDGWSAQLSHHRQGEERDRLRTGDRRDLQGFDVTTLGATLRFEKATPGGVWTYGAETYHDDVSSFRLDFAPDGSLRSRAVQGPVADDASYRLSGVWVQRQHALGQRWQLILGGRHTRAEVEAGVVAEPVNGGAFSLSDAWDETTFSLRFFCSDLPGSGGRAQLFGGVSQAFRAPNLSDLTRLDTARSNEIETPSPGLDPETFLAWELGLRWGSPGLRAEVALFRTEIEDLIHRVPTGRVIEGDFEVVKRNGATGFSEGIELSAQLKLAPRWWVDVDAAWIDGEVDIFPTATAPSVREPLDRLPPTSGRLALRWQGDVTWLEVSLLAADRADDLSSRDLADSQRIPPGGTPSYAVLTLRGSWQIRERFGLTLGIENLGDEGYRIHGSGLNEAGRNVVAGVQVGF